MAPHITKYIANDCNNRCNGYWDYDDGNSGSIFLGFGAQPPTPEWGLMLNEGRQYIQTAPWLMIYPGLAIFIVVAIFNLWGDSLRDILDPRQD